MLVEHQHHNQPPPTTWIKQHGIHITTYSLLGGTNQMGHTCVHNSSTDARKSTSNRNRQQKKTNINIKQTTCQHILSSNNTKCNSAIGPHIWPRSIWFVAVVDCVCTFIELLPKEKQNTVVRAGGTPTPQTTPTHNLHQTTWNTHHHLQATRWYQTSWETQMYKQQ